MASIEKSWLSISVYGSRLNVLSTKILVLIMLMARFDIREQSFEAQTEVAMNGYYKK